MPYVTRIAFWNPAESAFGPYTPTPHRNRREAASTFALAQTCIRNAAIPLPKHTGSRCTAFWSLARVELCKPNGLVIESYALPRSARKAIAAGRRPNLKQASAQEPTWKKAGSQDSLAVVAKSDAVIPVNDVVVAPTQELAVTTVEGVCKNSVLSYYGL